MSAAIVESHDVERVRGERVRTARLAKRLTQGQLAVKLGVSKAAISLWETGTAQPTSRHLRQLSVELGQSTDYFYGVDQ